MFSQKIYTYNFFGFIKSSFLLKIIVFTQNLFEVLKIPLFIDKRRQICVLPAFGKLFLSVDMLSHFPRSTMELGLIVTENKQTNKTRFMF